MERLFEVIILEDAFMYLSKKVPDSEIVKAEQSLKKYFEEKANNMKS